MNTSDFEFLRNFLRDRAGLQIADDKAYLLESRLLPVARRWRHADIAALVLSLRGFAEPGLRDDVVGAMMDHHTTFFRDIKTFRYLETTLLPELIAARKSTKRLRIWCAGAASGQEAYSLAMLLKEMGAYGHGWKIEIVATDISALILQVAKNGVYSQFEVQRGLPIAYLLRYFDQLSDQRWQVNHTIRQLVTFQKRNLLEDMSSMGAFDLILCRNVLSGMYPENRRGVLESLRASCGDGHLLLGADEDAGACELKASEAVRGLYSVSA